MSYVPSLEALEVSGEGHQATGVTSNAAPPPNHYTFSKQPHQPPPPLFNLNSPSNADSGWVT